METPRHDIEIRRGATFEIGFTYRDPQGAPVNLTGYGGRMQVRDRIGGRVLADASTANGQMTFVELEGKVKVRIPPSVTKLITSTEGVYDLLLNAAEDDAVYLVEGDVKIHQSVTQG